MDPDKLAGLLGNGHLWIVVAAAFGFGVVGALLHRDTQPQQNAAPRSWLDLLGGGVAAVAVLYLTNPASGVALVGGSLVAGYASKAVLAGLEARVVAAIAKTEAKIANEQARQAHADAAVAQSKLLDARADMSKLVGAIDRLDTPDASHAELKAIVGTLGKHDALPASATASRAAGGP